MRDARSAAPDELDMEGEIEIMGDGEFVVEAFDTEEELAKALCLEVGRRCMLHPTAWKRPVSKVQPE